MKTNPFLRWVAVAAAASLPILSLHAQDGPPDAPRLHVRIASPVNGQVFLAPAEISIVAVPSSSLGWVPRVEFFANGTSLGVAEPDPATAGPLTPYRWVWREVTAGDYTLTAVATDSAGTSATSDPVKIRVLEARKPLVTITAPDTTAREQSPLIDSIPDTALMVVRRTGETAEPLTVFYMVGGTAEPGKDYPALPGSVTIPEGQAAVEIPLEALDDDLVEPTETVTVTLIIPLTVPEVPPPYWTGELSTVRLSILDDEPRPNEPPRVSIISPPDGASFAAPESLTLLAMAADPDGAVASVEFFNGDQSLGKALPPLPDPILGPIQPDELYPEWGPILPFRLVWENPPAGIHRLTAVATDNEDASTTSAVVEIQILEGALPVVTVVATDPEGAEVTLGEEGTAAGNPAVFTLRRSGPTAEPLEVPFKLAGTAENGVDYTEVVLVATIPAGEGSVEVPILPIDDDLAEGKESVILSLEQPDCFGAFPTPPGCYVVGLARAARAAILDNEPSPNEPPKVEMTHPHDGAVFAALSDIPLRAVAWDTDGEVAKVEFFQGDTSLGLGEPELTGTRASYRLVWEDVPAGAYVLTAVATDNDGATRTSRPVEIKVVSLERPPVVTIETIDGEAAEPIEGSEAPSNPAVFRVHRTGPVAGALTVYYLTGGAAKNGVDYAELPRKVTIPAEAEAAEIVVDPLADILVEGPESVVLTLLPGLCVSDDTVALRPDYVVGNPHTARAVILDHSPIGNVPPKIALVKPESGQVFIAPASIPLVAAVRDPDGYVPLVEFFAGEEKIGEQSVAFLVEPEPGQDQTFEFLWEGVKPGRYVLRARATDDQGARSWSAPVSIAVVEEIQPTVVSVVALDPLAIEPSGEEPVNPGVFVVRRKGDLSLPLTVQYAIAGTAENGVDYSTLTGEVTIPESEEAVRVVVNPLADDAIEEPETVVVELVEPACIAIVPPPPGCYTVGDLGRAEVKILDRGALPNRPPRIEIVRPHPGEVFQVPAAIRIVAMAGDPDGRVVKVAFYAGDTLLGEHLATERDTLADEAPAFVHVWENAPVGRHVLTAVATDDDGATTTSREVPVAVIEGSAPPRVLLVATDPYAAERGDGVPPNTATFKVRRTGPLTADLTVFYSLAGTAENGVDYTELTGQVVIPAGKRTARIVVTPINDADPERVETVIAQLEPSPTASPIDPYHVGWPARACAIIVDNDEPQPAFRAVPRDGFQVCLPGVDGMPYRIEASDDLVDWIPVADGLATGGNVQFVEPGASEWRHRFYRMRSIAVEALDLDE